VLAAARTAETWKRTSDPQGEAIEGFVDAVTGHDRHGPLQRPECQELLDEFGHLGAQVAAPRLRGLLATRLEAAALKSIERHVESLAVDRVPRR
jgi:hypothetical protein